MKNMFDNSETFTAYATIAAGYYMLGELHKEMEVHSNRVGIVKMIDEQTGYMKAKTLEWQERSIAIMEDIIEAKKVLDDDSSKEEYILTTLKEKLKTLQK